MSIGVEVASGEWWIDAMEFEGAMTTGIDVARESTVMHSSGLVSGTRPVPAIALHGGREVTIANSVFIREAGVMHAAVSMDKAAMSSSRPMCSPVTAEMSWQASSADTARRFLTGNFEVAPNVP